jgi:glycosyltransferase involved in cell wall biosynthesis
MRPGEVTTLDRISDTEMSELLSISQLVVIDSFDEGLSLPVLEALQANAKIVASDIPAHRELLGRGPYFIDPRKPKSASQVIKRTLSKRKQNLKIKCEYKNLEQSDQEFLTRSFRENEYVTPPAVTADSRLKVAFATPWPPQKSGVADYSAATAAELGKLVDLTVFSTGSEHRNVDELLANPESNEFDMVISVVGNSHYHLPYIELTTVRDCMVISHDARLNEFYLALRGLGGLRQLMEASGRKLRVEINDQIQDMRLLEDAAFWEIARRASPLIFHTPVSAEVIKNQTLTTPQSLLFSNYRSPIEETVTPQLRMDAKLRLGLDPNQLHLVTFGFADNRTKLTDEILEAAIWLNTWGFPVALHVVGAATTEVRTELESRAYNRGFFNFDITGYVSETQYRDFVLAADIGIQLRVSPFLGVSGPLSDLAAHGTRALASAGLTVDVDTPDFVSRLDKATSPVIVATNLAQMISEVPEYEQIEVARRAYVDQKNPMAYALDLLKLINLTTDSSGSVSPEQ